MLLGTLAAFLRDWQVIGKLLASLLPWKSKIPGRGVIRAGEKKIKASEGTVRVV